MHRRHVTVPLVAALLVVAGCSGPLSDGSTNGPTATVTDRPAGGSTPTDPPATEGNATSLADVDYPRGFSRTDVRMPVARNRTLTLLNEESVTVAAHERFRPGAYVDYEYAANETHARFRLDVHNGDADVTRRDTYVDPTARYVRAGRNGRVSYDTSNVPVAVVRHRSGGSLWAVLSRMLVLGDYRATAVDDDGDRRHIRYELVGTVVEDASDQRGCLVVDADGVISRARLAYTLGGERNRFEYVLRRQRNVTVDRPAWLTDVAEASGDARSMRSKRSPTACVDGLGA